MHYTLFDTPIVYLHLFITNIDTETLSYKMFSYSTSLIILYTEQMTINP
jgi:hypothetical protein